MLAIQPLFTPKKVRNHDVQSAHGSKSDNASQNRDEDHNNSADDIEIAHDTSKSMDCQRDPGQGSTRRHVTFRREYHEQSKMTLNVREDEIIPSITAEERCRTQESGRKGITKLQDSSDSSVLDDAPAIDADEVCCTDAVHPKKAERDSVSSKPLPQCDICFIAGIPKKPTKEALEEEISLLSSVEVDFEGNKIRPFELVKNVRTDEAISHGAKETEAKVYSSSDCMKDFRKIQKPQICKTRMDVNKKEKDRKERDFRKYMERYCNRRSRNHPGSSKSTVASRQCFLKHKGDKPCLEGNTAKSKYRPAPKSGAGHHHFWCSS